MTVRWFVRKSDRILGPFSVKEISDYLARGRVRISDKVSQDGETWEQVTQVPEMIPDELLNTHNPAWVPPCDKSKSGESK